MNGKCPLQDWASEGLVPRYWCCLGDWGGKHISRSRLCEYKPPVTDCFSFYFMLVIEDVSAQFPALTFYLPASIPPHYDGLLPILNCKAKYTLGVTNKQLEGRKDLFVYNPRLQSSTMGKSTEAASYIHSQGRREKKMYACLLPSPILLCYSKLGSNTTHFQVSPDLTVSLPMLT